LYVANFGANKKWSQFLIPETIVNPAPLTAQFSNQLFEDFKKLYELKPFINLDGYGSHFNARIVSTRVEMFRLPL
jgi:hypothetical protein